MRIALVTCRVLPEPDPDEAITLEAFRGAGCEVELAAWDDETVDWSLFDLALLRSTWNYHLDPAGFKDWIRIAAGTTRLLNPAHVVEWNLDKHYLLELQSVGVPIVPTNFDSAISNVPWEKFVVKPSISCGSYMTRFFTRESATEAHSFADEISQTRGVMIQPYMESVHCDGERSIIWIDGEITHAIKKQPRFSYGEESVSGAYDPTSEEKDVSMRAVAAAPGSPLYARIDLMRNDDGRWYVSELELIEPSLFFAQHPPALERFVCSSLAQLRESGVGQRS